MILYLLALAAVIAITEILTLRRALDGVEYDMRLSRALAEPGEQVELISVITNRRRRFLPFLRLGENVPDGITVAGTVMLESARQRRGELRSTVYLMPRQRLTRRTPFSMDRRGRWLFLGARLYGGDFLGLNEKERVVNCFSELVVLPAALPAAGMTRLMGGWMGDHSVNRFLMEDPVLTVGFRDYTGHEPMKMISWTQTARTGALTVRCQDYTVERSVTVLLNYDTFAFNDYGEEMLERCLELCRGVCEYLEEQRVPYALLTNGCAAGMPDGFGEVPGGLGRAHLMTALEGMGRADGRRWATLNALFDRALAGAAPGRGHIFVTPVRQDVHPELIEQLRRATGEMPLVLVAEEVSGK